MTPKQQTTVHRHNLLVPTEKELRFGLRLRLPAGDTFNGILGDDWQKERWFATERDRNEAIAELRRQHPYYRLGDRPTLQIEKINRSGTGAASG